MFEKRLACLNRPQRIEEIAIGDSLLFYSKGEESMVEGVVAYLPERRGKQVFVVKNLYSDSVTTLHFDEDEFYKVK